MMIRHSFIPFVVLMTLYAIPVGAKGVCGDRASMVEKLVNKYGESKRGGGMAGALLLEVWANCITGTWTVLKTYPRGTACVMAAGEDWHGVGCDLGQLV